MEEKAKEQNQATTENPTESRLAGNFIHDEIEADLAAGHAQAVHTRFPPEPRQKHLPKLWHSQKISGPVQPAL